MVWVETPTNINEVGGYCSKITKANNILFAVDNTLQHRI
jgi:cystathionine beta-lyase/cystathionine gamma-synthase